MRLTCDVPVVPGHCLQPVAWAVAHVPSGLARVASVTITYIDPCASARPCPFRPHYYEWWAAFTLWDGTDLGMWVSNTFGRDEIISADVGATPPPGAQPVFGSFTLMCGTVPDVTCTGAAGGSTGLSPNKPPRTVSVGSLAGSKDHYLVTLTFADGTAAIVEVAPDKQQVSGWSSVAIHTR
jgi:hypothetical protein